MLSGISHDLRTPLTRMKLQLAFIKDNDQAKKISDDINEMEKMLNEYLQFASSNFSEKNEIFDLSELINQVIDNYQNKKISKKLLEKIKFNGRKNLIKRCLNNLIDNSIKYSNNIKISLTESKGGIYIDIDDDGPGIPPEEYENVFKPFYKIDKGRSDAKSSVGLGLSITSDIIRSHGGFVKLGNSQMNGLKVRVFLPI